MSDTLPASARRVNSSGNCSISGCPCRGWSAQETASVKEVSECQSDHPWTNCPKCGVGICGEHMTAWLNHQPHQPAARGGGESKAGEALAQYRQAVIEREYPMLVAERERLLQSLKEVAIPSLRYCEQKYDHDDQARLNLEALVESIEQRSTSA